MRDVNWLAVGARSRSRGEGGKEEYREQIQDGQEMEDEKENEEE